MDTYHKLTLSKFGYIFKKMMKDRRLEVKLFHK